MTSSECSSPRHSDTPESVPFDDRPRPVADAVTTEYWKWIQQEQLRLQWCECCARLIFPPTPYCAGCRTAPSQWRQVSGRGTVVSSGVVRKSFVPGHPPPYAVVWVRLAEQDDLEMVSNFPMEGDRAPTIGRPAQLTFERRDWGLLPQFVPGDSHDE